MLKQRIKRMVLTGATVMVLMSTAAPAMAVPATMFEDPSSSEGNSYASDSCPYVIQWWRCK